MSTRTAEDILRAEYFARLEEVRLVAEELETRVRHAIMPVALSLSAYERVRVASRIKECESAVNALRRRQEGKSFDPTTPERYTLADLKDLVGAKVMVFPRSRVSEVDELLRKEFPDWHPDHILDPNDSEQPLMFKYHGYCKSSAAVRGEYQIVPLLAGLFLDVEHSALYKPTPALAGVSRSLEMQERKKEVLSALASFEQDFARLIRESTEE